MKGKALALANNDLVYLWWTYPEKIPGCLGFTIHRMDRGKEPEPLPAYVGFEPKSGTPVADIQKNTDYWPIQSYNWKDLFVPHGTDVSYRIIPVTGTPDKKLDEIPGLAIETGTVRATEDFGRYRVIFNVGIIATQSLAKVLDSSKKDGVSGKTVLEKHIKTPGDPVRKSLSGGAVPAIKGFVDQAVKDGGTCYCALYECTDPELRDLLLAAKGHVEIILANADSTTIGPDKKSEKVYDGTNKETRDILHDNLGDACHDYFMPKGNYIGHNKFVVFTDKSGKPRSVLTGSTNWTPTGLCTQTNNIIIINDPAVAARYMDYWQRLLADNGKTTPALRSTNASGEPVTDLGSGEGSFKPWFSPNTKTKTKPKKNCPTPPDMDEIFQAIEKAEHGALFLLFNAGEPSIMNKLTEVSGDHAKNHKPFFVRGAISDSDTAGQYGTNVYNNSLLDNPNTLITGVGGVPDTYSYWEKEIAQMGHAVIHDKILVLDPFSSDCVVITGSHNLGFKASFSNTENICMIRGNQAVAATYAAHILDVVNHYNWRNKLNAIKKEGKDMKTAYYDLDETDRWQDKYFTGNFLKSRDQFFF